MRAYWSVLVMKTHRDHKEKPWDRGSRNWSDMLRARKSAKGLGVQELERANPANSVSLMFHLVLSICLRIS